MKDGKMMLVHVYIKTIKMLLASYLKKKYRPAIVVLEIYLYCGFYFPIVDLT